MIRISVIYHSVTGTTKRMAEAICKGASSVNGVECMAFPIESPDAEYVNESKCVILGTPVYYASMSGTVKMWFEKTRGQFGLQGKLAGAFATADYIHGGGEIAIQSILSHMMVSGMMAYSGGGAYGKPVIHLGPVGIKSDIESYVETFRIYGERMAMKTLELFG